MKDKTPILDQLRARGDGFKKASPDFFQELSARIEQETARPAVAKRRRLWPLGLSAAAAVLLFLLLWRGGITETDTLPTVAEAPAVEDLLDELSDDDILAYIEDNMSDFELELLAEDTEF
ncbi:MAG: hypothetical protein AAF433_14760 [Bacteroidota bacterium]